MSVFNCKNNLKRQTALTWRLILFLIFWVFVQWSRKHKEVCETETFVLKHCLKKHTVSIGTVKAFPLLWPLPQKHYYTWLNFNENPTRAEGEALKKRAWNTANTTVMWSYLVNIYSFPKEFNEAVKLLVTVVSKTLYG